VIHLNHPGQHNMCCLVFAKVFCCQITSSRYSMTVPCSSGMPMHCFICLARVPSPPLPRSTDEAMVSLILNASRPLYGLLASHLVYKSCTNALLHSFGLIETLSSPWLYVMGILSVGTMSMYEHQVMFVWYI
jgi:hypothetical protein